jgi:hypothetical protein
MHHSATYVPFGSFQSPSPQYHRAHKRIQDPQSPDMIKREVTSCAVKPLYARPCFPKQAHLFPNENAISQHTDRNVLQHSQYQGERVVKQGPAPSSNKQIRECPGDENFVYIHRHNSFIDMSQMTHHDHSQNQSDDLGRSLSRSPQEVDAAMTLATCLHK